MTWLQRLGLFLLIVSCAVYLKSTDGLTALLTAFFAGLGGALWMGRLK